jgi:hypothetical protein
MARDRKQYGIGADVQDTNVVRGPASKTPAENHQDYARAQREPARRRWWDTVLGRSSEQRTGRKHEGQ